MAEYQTLKLNSDFRRTYGRGKSAADPVLVTYALKNRYGVMRIGITTGKQLEALGVIGISAGVKVVK